MKLSHNPSAADLEAALHESVHLMRSGRAPAAIRLLRDVLRFRPDSFDALHLLGAARVAGGRVEEGIADLAKAGEMRPEAPAVWVNLASALERVGRLDEAIAGYEKAAELVPDADEANHRLCLALSAATRFEEALARAEAYVALHPASGMAYLTLGLVQSRMGTIPEAVQSFTNAQQRDPTNVLAKINLAFALGTLKDFEGVVPLLTSVAAARPSDWEVLSKLIHAKRTIHDWEGIEALEKRLVAAATREAVPSADALSAICDAPELLKRTVQARARSAMPLAPKPLRPDRPYGHDRIRLGYLSGDYRRHPVAQCITGLIEVHDRKRFEVIGVSYGPDDGSEARQRAAAACDRFVDMVGRSQQDIAREVRALEIDIAIELSGITEFGAPDILAYMPAPVQVNYLGYPGTLGVPWLDYLIADNYVLPPHSAKHYTEAIVRLPGCFFPPANRPAPGGTLTSRAEHGLPQNAFVFASFNSPNKLSPAIFAAWMRLLKAVPGSVLWMRASGAVPDRRLREAAAAHGVEPGSIHFAGSVPGEADHLARLGLADLFLDSFPYGAHTTASDALWAGLPILTISGEIFASRVAASMLTQCGLPELIVPNLAAYEALALELARDRDRLANIRTRLAHARDSGTLFDLDLYRRRIEAAYSVMHDRARRGLARGPIEAAVLSG